MKRALGMAGWCIPFLYAAWVYICFLDTCRLEDDGKQWLSVFFFAPLLILAALLIRLPVRRALRLIATALSLFALAALTPVLIDYWMASTSGIAHICSVKHPEFWQSGETYPEKWHAWYAPVHFLAITIFAISAVAAIAGGKRRQ